MNDEEAELPMWRVARLTAVGDKMAKKEVKEAHRLLPGMNGKDDKWYAKLFRAATDKLIQDEFATAGLTDAQIEEAIGHEARRIFNRTRRDRGEGPAL